MTDRLYLDTEFNGFGGELISLALVSPEGHEWYAAKTIQAAYHPWVAENVVPKLGAPLMPPAIFKDFFQGFVQGFSRSLKGGPTIICDWYSDAIHFLELLQGDTHGMSLSFHGSIVIVRPPNGAAISANPHNALDDARALMEWHETTL